ncbi:hypothetical protein AJ80_05155 [Polytolypa hystricis UAMH7299]|uniref:Uncharacterized protein n=1 Tax=Polytolypa hystricis (strain UAMH7299) TaxID=1447883 RepID=A0A2B7Y6J0_POLH7|nr:hypothetical protein AJ80_05155 [Polytolypa hystricis UAMH7299]
MDNNFTRHDERQTNFNLYLQRLCTQPDPNLYADYHSEIMEQSGREELIRKFQKIYEDPDRVARELHGRFGSLPILVPSVPVTPGRGIEDIRLDNMASTAPGCQFVVQSRWWWQRLGEIHAYGPGTFSFPENPMLNSTRNACIFPNPKLDEASSMQLDSMEAEKAEDANMERRAAHIRETAASRPYFQFLFHMSKCREWYTRGSKASQVSDTEAYAFLKELWIDWEIWDPKWDFLPEMTWSHETRVENRDEDPLLATLALHALRKSLGQPSEACTYLLRRLNLRVRELRLPRCGQSVSDPQVPMDQSGQSPFGRLERGRG